MAEYRVEQVMGMPVGIELSDDNSGRTLDRAFAWLRAVDRAFSTYREDSEISRLDRGELALAQASPAAREVLALAEAVRVQTLGFFDVRATGRLDPSGLVKGWAVERAGLLLTGTGTGRLCMNAGGDILLRGEEPWRVGIQHPRRRDRLACVVEMSSGAIATSGAYERGDHIVDPHSGRPPTGVLSVTVLGPDLATADAYATAAFAMGATGGPVWTASLADHGFHAMTILDNDRVLCTPGFLARCAGGSVAASLAG